MGHAERIIYVDFKNRTKEKAEPSKRIRKPGEGLVRAGKIAEVETLRVFMESANTEEELRSRIILEFLSRFGMRASELVILKKSDFVTDADGLNLLRYFRPKRNDWHSVKITTKAKDFLLALVESYHSIAGIQNADKILFSVKHPWTKLRTELTTRSLQRIVNSFGLKDGRGKLLAPHGLRHFAGIKAVKTRDHIAGSKLLGNSERVFAEYYSDPSTEALD